MKNNNPLLPEICFLKKDLFFEAFYCPNEKEKRYIYIYVYVRLYMYIWGKITRIGRIMNWEMSIEYSSLLNIQACRIPATPPSIKRCS